MCGDDLYSKKDIEECIKYPFSALVTKINENQNGGRVYLNEDNTIKEIREGNHPSGSIVATGLYVLDKSVFTLPLVKAENGKEEYGLPQTLMHFDQKIHAVFATNWYQVTQPKDLELSKDKLTSFT